MLQRYLLLMIVLLFSLGNLYAADDNDSGVKELSLPYSVESSCSEKMKLNNIKFPGFIRSDCFSKNGRYYYYICEKGSQCLAVSSSGEGDQDQEGELERIQISSGTTNYGPKQNPYSVGFDKKLSSKLVEVVGKITKMDLKQLQSLGDKLDRLSVKYKNNKTVSNLINYLQFEVKRIIDEKTKNDDVDDFFCELTGNCEEDINDDEGGQCKSWYDGCNTCALTSSGETACTQRYCIQQGEPRCMDDDSTGTGATLSKDDLTDLAEELQKTVCNQDDSTNTNTTGTFAFSQTRNVKFCGEYLAVEPPRGLMDAPEMRYKLEFGQIKDEIACGGYHTAGYQMPAECSIPCEATDYGLCPIEEEATCSVEEGFFVHDNYMYYTEGEGDYCKIKPSSEIVVGGRRDGKITEYASLPEGMTNNKGKCGFGLDAGAFKIGDTAYYSNGVSYCKYKSSEQEKYLSDSATKSYSSIPATLVGWKICGEDPKLPNNCEGGKIYKVEENSVSQKCSLEEGFFVYKDFMYYTNGNKDYCKIKPSSEITAGGRRDGKITEYESLPSGMTNNKGDCGYGLAAGNFKLGNTAYYSNGVSYCKHKPSDQYKFLNSSETKTYTSIPDSLVGWKICGEDPKLPNNCEGGTFFQSSDGGSSSQTSTGQTSTEGQKVLTFESSKGPGGGTSTWSHTVDYTDLSKLKIGTEIVGSNIDLKSHTINFNDLGSNQCTQYIPLGKGATISSAYSSYLIFCKKGDNKLAIYHRIEWESAGWKFTKGAARHGIIELKAGAQATQTTGIEDLDNYTSYADALSQGTTGGTLVDGGYTTDYNQQCVRPNVKTGECNCQDGFTTESATSFIGEYRYNCIKKVASINGVCGSVNGLKIGSRPTYNLCKSGNVGTTYNQGGYGVDGEGYYVEDGKRMGWTWKCRGIGTGTSEQTCNAQANGIAKKGVCAYPSTTTTKPSSAGLCKYGEATNIRTADSGKRWAWNCEGENYGYSPICVSLIGYSWNGTKWTK